MLNAIILHSFAPFPPPDVDFFTTSGAFLVPLQQGEMHMSHTITLTENYGYSTYKAPSGLDDNTTIDATGASWIVANQGSQTNLYPFQVSGAGNGLLIKGGTITGEVSQTGDWESTYINSAALRVNSANSFVIDDWTITQPWDGIRPGGTGTFVIEDTYIANSRDDAVENDDAIGGTIRDSLFDNVFSGVSLGDGDVDGSDNTVTMDGMLLGMKEYLYKGEMTHGSPFKLDKGTGSADVVPDIKFINNVVAIEDVSHIGMERLQRAWDKTVESTGNYYLNLSDTPLPSDYPKPGEGWTILQGQAAREYWDKAHAAWVDNHDGTPAATPAPTPESTPAPEPTPLPTPAETPTFSGTSYSGSGSSDTIIGNDLDNTINAGNGADTVWGGAGSDVLVFSRGGDMDGGGKVDVYMDFEHGADRFDLKLVDANEMQSGDQAFVFIGEAAFGSSKPGEMRSVYDATGNVTRIELNTDSDISADYAFHVDGRHSFVAADFIL
jgi:RTX calcium-binding nonapeptide repeat (4 copies)